MEKVDLQPSLLTRGEDYCRACNSKHLFSALNLGTLPIANELNKTPLDKFDLFKLHLKICEECGLGQVADVVSSNRLFEDYRYLSSASTSFKKHAENYVRKITEKLKIEKEDYVLEIASNDGYLLSNFMEKGIKVLGVEPAQNIAVTSRSLGIPTIANFFGEELAEEILSKYGYPRLIIANNVLAHVPDIQDFMKGLARLSNSRTRISVENPRLRNIIEKNQFDTIYHEHFSYLSCKAVHRLASESNLLLYDLDSIETHGGSNRYWLMLDESGVTQSESLKTEIQKEILGKLFEPSTWINQQAIVKDYLVTFRQFLEAQINLGKTIVGYGAAAKASTLINSAQIEKKLLPSIADVSFEKQGRFMPSKNIQIISPQNLVSMRPDIIVLFVWNISSEILQWVNANGLSETEVWQTIPELKRIH
jgi:hypothetical protein